MTTKEHLPFRYKLGIETPLIVNGDKLHNPTIKVQQIIVLPGKEQDQNKYWLVTGVSDWRDVGVIGEILINVESRTYKEHETYVTVESGVRQGALARASVARNSKLDVERREGGHDVRDTLLESWYALKEKGFTAEKATLSAIYADMEKVRMPLRVDGRDRLGHVRNFRDKTGRLNNYGSAAALTAFIARLWTVAGYDAITEKALRNRYLTCTTMGSCIDSDIWDLQVLLSRMDAEPDKDRKLDLIEQRRDFVAERLARLQVKPYFWAIVWATNSYPADMRHRPEGLRYIIEALLAEQTLGQVDMMFSELKRSADMDVKRNALRIVTMSLANQGISLDPYNKFFSWLRAEVRRELPLTKSMDMDEYARKVKRLQKVIRNRWELVLDARGEIVFKTIVDASGEIVFNPFLWTIPGAQLLLPKKSNNTSNPEETIEPELETV